MKGEHPLSFLIQLLAVELDYLFNYSEVNTLLWS